MDGFGVFVAALLCLKGIAFGALPQTLLKTFPQKGFKNSKNFERKWFSCSRFAWLKGVWDEVPKRTTKTANGADALPVTRKTKKQRKGTPMDRSSLPALRGLLEKSEQTLRRAEDFFRLFVLESAEHLLAQMCEKKQAEDCLTLFEEYLRECDPRVFPKETLSVQIALEICRLATERGINLPFFKTELLPPPADLCYVKSRFTETLIPLLEEEHAIYYAEDFEDACIKASEGTRQGCLLPYMGEDRLPLQGVARLIDEYDLKKCRYFHVDSGDQDCVYLLLSAHLRPEKDADHMEIMAASGRKMIEAVLALCEKQQLLSDLPAPLRGVHDPASRSDTHFCRFTLQGSREDLSLFYGVLRLCLPESTICGLYDRVELIE